jgi:hypothetical protein
LTKEEKLQWISFDLSGCRSFDRLGVVLGFYPGITNK